jgi:hydroxymethylbilane synthase
VRAILAPMEHDVSRLRASAERGVLKALNADCTVPLAAHAVVNGDRIDIEAWLSDESGARYRTLKDSVNASDAATAERFGLELGAKLLAN